MKRQVEIWNKIMENNLEVQKHLGKAFYDKDNDIGVFPKVSGTSVYTNRFLGSDTFFMRDAHIAGNILKTNIGSKYYYIPVDLGEVYPINSNDVTHNILGVSRF